MKPTGQGELKIFLLGEAPGRVEDEKNTQFVGDVGDFLRDKLTERGLDLDRDFYKDNSLRCRPFIVKKGRESNRPPKRNELKFCRQHHLDYIREMKPDFIWLMGKAAIESYYMDRFSDEEGTDLTPSRWRALCIPDPYSKAWVIPLFHPSYAMRNEHDNLTISQYERDLDFAISCLKKDPPVFFNPYDKIEIIKDFNEIVQFLKDIIANPPEFFTFDYETTGLKPFNKGHRIASISYCDSDNVAYSFPTEHPCFTLEQQRQIMELWAQVLQLDCGKTAHSLKFEDVWSQCRAKTKVRNWTWCSMNAAHILDNRKSFSGLKFQAFIRWGIDDYDKKVRPFLRSKKGSDFNKIFDAPLDDLLLYGGIDSLLERKLYLEQKEEMTPKLREVNDFFLDGLIAFADIQMNGICADRKFYEGVDKEIEDTMVNIIKDLLSSDEALLFRQQMGHELSLTSDYDLRDLFFKVLKLPPGKETDGGKFSVDASVLKGLKSPFAKKLMNFSRLDKVKGTYIGQFLREIDDDDKLRPFFDLHKAISYRSSSSRPNWQNIPVRNKEAKRLTRSGIHPSPGNIILDFDFSGAEVRIAAIVSKDPVLRAYINDPTSDMHRDLCMELLRLKEKQVTKDLRFHAKNSFTFAQFYGSYHVSCAEGLWEIFNSDDDLKTTNDVHILDHLSNVGITSYEEFEEHVRQIETRFWKKYHVFKRWQEKTWAFYEKHGYIELLSGFRCSGYMTRNQILNLPIQGPAFHCLLYSLINIHNELLDRRLYTKIMGQIHDNLIFDCKPSEKKEIMELSNYIVSTQIRKDWKWVTVPLEIEFSESKVDGNWCEMEDL